MVLVKADKDVSTSVERERWIGWLCVWLVARREVVRLDVQRIAIGFIQKHPGSLIMYRGRSSFVLVILVRDIRICEGNRGQGLNKLFDAMNLYPCRDSVISDLLGTFGDVSKIRV